MIVLLPIIRAIPQGLFYQDIATGIQEALQELGHTVQWFPLGEIGVLTAAEANPAFAAHKAWFTADRRRREGQILIAIGELSPFVGDGSPPLHVTVHFNGWGDFPHPHGYTTAHGHRPFEPAFVHA